MSAAGGLDKIFSRGADIGAECLQMFTRSPSQWRAAPLAPPVLRQFAEARAAAGVPVYAHDIYLTNLAAAEPEVRQRSLDSLVEEVRRCQALGLDGLVCHMGSHLDTQQGLDLLAAGLVQVLQATEDCTVPILMETTAGQGSCLGHRFEHLGYCLERNDHPPRLGVCLDTCHVLAGGYDLASADAVDATLQAFDQAIGLSRLRLLHLNDSKKALASRVDRHHHIGQGHIGLAGFRALLRHPALQHLPMIIETPEMESMHRINLETLRQLRAGG